MIIRYQNNELLSLRDAMRNVLNSAHYVKPFMNNILELYNEYNVFDIAFTIYRDLEICQCDKFQVLITILEASATFLWHLTLNWEQFKPILVSEDFIKIATNRISLLGISRLNIHMRMMLREIVSPTVHTLANIISDPKYIHILTPELLRLIKNQSFQTGDMKQVLSFLTFYQNLSHGDMTDEMCKDAIVVVGFFAGYWKKNEYSNIIANKSIDILNRILFSPNFDPEFYVLNNTMNAFYKKGFDEEVISNSMKFIGDFYKKYPEISVERFTFGFSYFANKISTDRNAASVAYALDKVILAYNKVHNKLLVDINDDLYSFLMYLFEKIHDFCFETKKNIIILISTIVTLIPMSLLNFDIAYNSIICMNEILLNNIDQQSDMIEAAVNLYISIITWINQSGTIDDDLNGNITIGAIEIASIIDRISSHAPSDSKIEIPDTIAQYIHTE